MVEVVLLVLVYLQAKIVEVPMKSVVSIERVDWQYKGDIKCG